jgi:hypothetical protein
MKKKWLDTGSDQLVADGMQPRRRFRVMRPDLVSQKDGMRDIGNRVHTSRFTDNSR